MDYNGISLRKGQLLNHMFACSLPLFDAKKAVSCQKYSEFVKTRREKRGGRG
jgi:hypothetical protein